MAMTQEEFILRTLAQLNFNTMPEAQRRQFASYVDKDDFRGDMKWWRDNLLKKGADGKPFKDSNGLYVHNDLPDGTRGATKMDDKDWDDLYLGLYNTFVAMDANRKNLSRTEDGKKALAFVDKYFGDDESIYTFALQKLDASLKEEIDKLLTIFKNDPNLYLFVGIDAREDREKLESLIGKKDKLDKPENRSLVYRLVSGLNYRLSDLKFAQESDSEFIRYIKYKKTFDGYNLDNLETLQEVLYKGKEVTDNDRKKLQRDIGEILKTLHSNSKIYGVFKASDKSKISELMDEALAKTDYTGKVTEKDYIKPKYEDTLDWKEKLQKKTKALYDDTLKKYLTAHRDHVYKMDTAKAIGDVITGLKDFNYNDGLDKIIKDNKDAIIKALHDKQPLKSIDHFKWFVEQIESFQNNGKGKDVAGALRDGDKMNDLVEDLAINAIDEAKNGKKDSIEKAKTAMEVLKVLQQPFFSGKTLDAIRKTDFSLLSDGNLSFNKSNPYIKGVMSAVDKTIGATIKGVAVAGTGLASLYNRRNLGFNKTGALEDGHQQFVKDNAAEKSLADAERKKKNRINRANIRQCLADIRAVGINNRADLKKTKDNLTKGKGVEDGLKTDYETARDTYAANEAIKTDYDNRKTLEAQQVAAKDDLQQLTQSLEQMKGAPKNQLDAMHAEQLKADHAKKLEELRGITDQIERINAKYTTASLDNEYARITSIDPATGKSILTETKDASDSAKKAYEDKQKANKDLENAIYTYESSKAKIKQNRDKIKERDDAFAKWDEEHQDYYYQLMGFWDFLQTGHTKNLIRLSTKKLQKKMDNGQMAQIYSDWMHDHAYAA